MDSAEEMNSAASGNESVEEEEMEVFEKPEGDDKKAKHPTYGKMLVEAIREQQTSNRQTGISRAKIVEYMKMKYNLEEVNASAFKKAVKVAEENEIIEHKTGTGASGSFILTKKERTSQLKKSTKPVEKPAEPKADSKPKPKPKAKAPAKKGKEKEVKTTKTKPPVPKGKENKDVKVKTKKDNTAEKKTLSKSKSNSKVTSVPDDAVPSTSKQRKAPAVKKAKSSSKLNA